MTLMQRSYCRCQPPLKWCMCAWMVQDYVWDRSRQRTGNVFRIHHIHKTINSFFVTCLTWSYTVGGIKRASEPQGLKYLIRRVLWLARPPFRQTLTPACVHNTAIRAFFPRCSYRFAWSLNINTWGKPCRKHSWTFQGDTSCVKGPFVISLPGWLH